MHRSHRRVRITVGLLLLGAAALACPGAATACGNAMEAEGVTVSTLLAADRQIRDGKHKLAAESVIQLYPGIKHLQDRSRLMLRSRRTIAVTVVRTDGLLPIPDFAAKTNDDRRNNLQWAIGVLREANEAAPGTPLIEALLGEALARLPEHMAEAYQILERLAEKDVLPTAHGYKALAELRRLMGDTEKEKAALEKAAVLMKAPPPSDPLPAPRPPSYFLRRFGGRG